MKRTFRLCSDLLLPLYLFVTVSATGKAAPADAGFVSRRAKVDGVEIHYLTAADDFAELSRTKLPMPVLSLGGEKANGQALGEQARLVATDATVVVLKDCGHWMMEEKPQETTEALLKFL